MSEKTFCPICGNPTRVWMGNARKDGLCPKHADMLKREEIYVNEKGLFVDSRSNKILNKEYASKDSVQHKDDYYNKYVENKSHNNKLAENNSAENANNQIKYGKCLTCSNSTYEDYLFCKSCYLKYKNKTLLLKVEKCLTVTLQDESYEGIFVCDDGHVVKSMAEREIDNYLFDKGIRHSYEPAYDIGTDKPLHPDFRLEEYLDDGTDVYIEYWGFDESHKEYTEQKKYKLDKYRKNKETLVCFYAKSDIKDIKFALKRKLKKENIKRNEINFEE